MESLGMKVLHAYRSLLLQSTSSLQTFGLEKVGRDSGALSLFEGHFEVQISRDSGT